jgi:uncharacterized protein (DUF1778 family)
VDKEDSTEAMIMATATTKRTAKRERLEARITREQKVLFQQAAAMRGQSLSDFIVSSAEALAEETIERHTITVSARDYAMIMEALLNPPEPNEHLKRAMARAAAIARD